MNFNGTTFYVEEAGTGDAVVFVHAGICDSRRIGCSNLGLYRSPGSAPDPIRERVREMDLIALRNEALELGGKRPLTPPAVERLTEFIHPLLLITAALDDDDLELAAKYMATQIPHAQHQIIQNAAHLPNMEAPTQFNQLVLNFLEI